jgi:hypothetical protein
MFFMDVTPTTAQTRSARGKSGAPKTKAAPNAAAAKLTGKSARRKKATALQDGIAAEPTDLGQLIATTAYFLAAERNFEPGHELEDWLEAERRVRSAS